MAFLPGLRVGLTLDSATFVQETRRVGSAIDRMGGNVARQNTLAERSFGKLNTAIGTAKNLLVGLGVGIGVGGLVSITRQISATSDEFLKLTGRLRVAIGETDNLAAVQQRLFDVSQATRQSIFTTSELFTRLANAMRESGQSADQLLSVTETLAQAVAVSGASTTEADAALRQLSQGLAAGALRGEELNSVMEQLPRLALAIAEGMGVSIGQLRELGKEGQLTTEAILEAIRSQAPLIAQEFAQVPVTIGDAMTQVRNSFTQLIGDSEKATGSTQTLAAALSTLAQTIGSAEFRAGFQEFIAEGIARFTTSVQEFQRVADGVEAFADHFVRFKDESLAAIEDLVNGVRDWMGARLSAAFDAVTAPINKTIAAFKGMYDAVVGQSYVPDMVNEIQGWMKRLEGPAMVDPATRASQKTIRQFQQFAHLGRIDEAVKQQQRAQSEMQRDLQRQADETRDLLLEPFRNFIRSAQSELADFFEEVFSGGVTSFKDLFDEALRLAQRFAAELAAMLVFNPRLVGGLAAGTTGVTPSLAQAAGGAARFPTIQEAGTISGWREGLVGGPAALGPPAWTWSQVLGAGALGALGGGLVGNFFGGQGALGGAAGGGLGAGLGFALGGPIGAIAGGLLGSVGGGFLGGLFGGGGGDNTGELRFTQGALGQFGRFGGENTFERPLQQAISGFDDAVTSFLTQRQEEIVNASLATLDRFKDRFPESDPSRGIERILRTRASVVLRATGFDAGRVLAGAAGPGGVAERTAQALELQRTISQLSGETTRFELELEDLQDQFDTAIAKARDFGLATAGLVSAQNDAIQALERRQQAELDALALSVINPFERLADPLRAFQTQLEFRLLNPAEQAARAAADFRRIANEAAAGSTVAIEQLTGAGQLFIEQAGRFGASPAQASAIQEVSRTLADVLGQIERARADAMRGIVDEDEVRDAQRRIVDRLDELVAETRLVADEIKRLRQSG